MHYTEREVHHILHDVIYVKESSSSLETRCLPLHLLAELLASSPENNTLNANYDEAQLRYSIEYSTNPTLSGRHVYADVGAGRTLGMVYKDFECLERYISITLSSFGCYVYMVSRVIFAFIYYAQISRIMADVLGTCG